MDKPTLIYKVLSGSASDAESSELRAWIASDPDNAEEFEDIKLLYEGSLDIEEKIGERDSHFYEGLQKIQDRIKALKDERAGPYKRAGIVVSISAVTIVLFMCFYYWREPLARRTDTMGNTIPSSIVLHDNLAFDEATLESIFSMLEKRYRVKFNVASEELLSCRFTGTFYRGIEIDEVIRVLAESEGFNYTPEDAASYALYGSGCR